MSKINERLEAAMKKSESRRIAVSRRKEYYKEFARRHTMFLSEIVAWYKKHGHIPDYAVFKLPIFYTEPKDKEVAIVAASLLKYGADIGELRHVLSEHPWEWFIDRNFVLLGDGSVQNNFTSGCQNWRLSALLDRFHKAVIKHNTNSIREAVLADAWQWNLSIENTLMRYCKSTDAEIGQYRMRLLLLAMSNHDTFGQGLWDIREPLRCPFTDDVERYLRMWIPDVGNYGTIDDCVPLFGLDTGDFFLSYFAYYELGNIIPKDLRRYATRYAGWYKDGNIIEGYRWNRYVPKIPD